jgi:hypothetical protein
MENSSPSPRRASAWPRSALWLAIVAGVLATLPSVDIGFFLDDYAQIALMESWYPLQADPANLYSFLGDLPLEDPWWKHPEFKVSMWRPLASLLLRLDNRLFGHDPLPYHLHSMLWYLATLIACGLLFRRLLPPRLASLALLVFAFDESHTLTAGWIANRYAMVAMVPTLLAVLAHLRWREDGWRPGLPLSIAGYAVGLAAGEVALGVMAYVFAYELLRLRRRQDRRRTGLIPVSAVALGYAVWYKIGGFGASHSGFYLDPTGQPLEFLRGAAGHVPALLAGALLGLPADLWFFAPAMRGAQVVAGAAAIVVFGVLTALAWPRLEETTRGALAWLLPGAAFALLPAAVAQPFDRVLVTPMIGVAVLLAALIGTWVKSARDAASSFARRAPAAIGAFFLIAVHLVVAPLGKLASQRFMAGEWKDLPLLADRIPVETAAGYRPHAVLLTAPDIVIGGFLGLMHGFRGHPPFASWVSLSLAPHDHLVHRTGPRSLELEVLDGELLSSEPERFHRPASERMQTGERAVTPLFEAVVLETGEQGPVRVRFRFDRDLDDPQLVFLAWGDGEVERVRLPAVGESFRVVQHPGPMAAALEDVSPF